MISVAIFMQIRYINFDILFDKYEKYQGFRREVFFRAQKMNGAFAVFVVWQQGGMT